jgi:type I restriction enzyme, S subunit
LIAKVGDPPGATAVYPDGLGEAVITQDVIRLRCDRSKVLPEYLKYYLNSEVGKHRVNPIIVEGTRSRFSLGDFKKIKIPVPSVASQKTFLKRIEKVEATIAVLRRNPLSTRLFDSSMGQMFS